IAHNADSLLVATNTDPIAFGITKSPGSQGADIVTGEGIGLCGHLSLGAPGVGLFATSQKLIRQIPGRLCGATLDSEGKFGFTLTLASREQHIRREKATSNICTNHALMALAFTISMSLYGKTGLQQLAKINLQKTIYFRKKAEAAGLKILFTGPFFNETVLAFASKAELKQRLENLESKDIFAGVTLGNWYKEYDHCLLINTTELHSDEAINGLISGLKN
ncbi:MAG: glycine dehydrogenase, partial [bacterium]|nr:glycine dehydrogenase [bacterium]